MNQPTEPTATYAEARGKAPFDWNNFLNKPTRTEGEWYDAWKLSSKWVTCACGNQCDALPRDDWGAPIDFDVRRLGVKFHEAICSEDRDTAASLLKEIEARTAALLAAL